MTAARTLLSVRLDPALAEALEEYCLDTGASRSFVVQEGLAQYLASRSGPSLSSLAEAVLPAAATAVTRRKSRASRQERFRKYVRAKRRR